MSMSMFSYTVTTPFSECSAQLKNVQVQNSKVACLAITVEGQKQKGFIWNCDGDSIVKAFPNSEKHCLTGPAAQEYFTTQAEDICKLVGATDDQDVSIFVCTQN